MNNDLLRFPATRRDFIKTAGKGIGLLAFSHYVPAFLTSSARAESPGPEKDRTILVLIQLAGGNDGLNTVIPTADDHYFKLRPTLAIKGQDALRLDDLTALHPALADLHALHGEGKVAVVQNVGYPNPNRSHFRSMDIWETASDADESVSTGWLGRYFDNACNGAPDDSPVGIHSSQEVPQAFSGEHSHNVFGTGGQIRDRAGNATSRALLEKLIQNTDDHRNEDAGFLKHTLMDALVTERRVQRIFGEYRPDAKYPGSGVAQSLRGVAALIAGGLSTRVYFVSHGGFDTHANQAYRHRALLADLSAAMNAFQRDLEAKGLADQVLTMTFSEFGRRPMENQGGGTDHGTAAPLFVMGKRVKGGLLGTPPSLDLPKNGDLKFSTDFRQVYATVLDRWLGCPSEKVLGSKHEPLAFL